MDRKIIVIGDGKIIARARLLANGTEALQEIAPTDTRDSITLVGYPFRENEAPRERKKAQWKRDIANHGRSKRK